MKTVRATGRPDIQLAEESRTPSHAASISLQPAPWRARKPQTPTGTFPAVCPEPAPPDLASTGDLIKDLQRENARLRSALADLEAYRRLAYRDALTGLWNRRYFEERLSAEISLGGRDSWRRFSLLALDINDLKRINDYEGHAAGDLMIKRTAGFLKTRLREHDVICRTGGDEFVVILRELGPPETAQLLARLRGELRAFNGRRPSQLSLALGTASFPEDGSTRRDLSFCADERMYTDKRRQKGLAVPGEPRNQGAKNRS